MREATVGGVAAGALGFCALGGAALLGRASPPLAAMPAICATVAVVATTPPLVVALATGWPDAPPAGAGLAPLRAYAGTGLVALATAPIVALAALLGVGDEAVAGA
ncbi:MAG: hypothetical protein ACOZNI_06100, partial [Myxococcota bacterium]